MNEYFQENKRSLLLLSGLLFILAIVLFFIIMRPLLADLSTQQKAIIDINGEINVLEQQLENMETSVEEIDIEQLILENKIPKSRDLDEYILSLQRLELLTDSRIESIEFVYDSSLDVSEEETAETETEAEDEVDTEDEVAEEEGIEEVTIAPSILNEKPDALQVMTVKLTAISPDFKEFIELLKVIENEERISIVTNLHFLKPAEDALYFADDPSKVIPFEAELTTFYYEE